MFGLFSSSSSIISVLKGLLEKKNGEMLWEKDSI